MAVALVAAAPGRAEESLLDTALAVLTAQTAEGIADIERQLESLDPLFVKAAAPVVAGLIADSRDAAVEQGVERIPDAIRAQLEGYVPAEVLDVARWCTECGGELSLQQATFRLGLSPAITLDYVIVFQSRDDALTDPALWVHELKHVMQFRDWGITRFATRYLEDYAGVEREAAEFRWEWVVLTGDLERRKARRTTE